MLRGILVSKTILILILLSLFSCNLDKVKNQEGNEYAFFENGITCDSTYIDLSKDGRFKTIYCIKDGTKSFVKIENEDTVLIRKHINKRFVEKTRFEKNKVSQKSLLMSINDTTENLLLYAYYDNQKIDLERSFFFEFMEQSDSLFFRLNSSNDFVINSDSIRISDFVGYYPVFNQVFDVSYQTNESINGWNYVSKFDLEKNKVITILIYSQSKLEEGGISIRTVYLDNLMYKWSNAVKEW